MRRKFAILSIITLLIVLACNLPAEVPGGLAGDVAATATANPDGLVTLPAETAALTAPAETPASTPGDVVITTAVVQQEGSAFCKIAYSNGASVYCTAPGRSPILLGNVNQQVYNLSLSPDGTLLVYMAAASDGADTLWLAHTNGTAAPQALVAGGQVAGPDPVYKTTISQMAWLPNSHILYFTTRSILDGPGEALNIGIWKVDADSTIVSKVFDPEDACTFFISPDGSKLVLSMPTQVQLTGLDGNNVQNVLTFDPVITYSEYAFKPQAQWQTDSQGFYLVIPSADPLAADSSASFYKVDANGIPHTLMTLPGNFLFGGSIPAKVSPDGNIIIYSMNGGSNDTVIHLVESNGSNDRLVTTVPSPSGFGWSPDSVHYAYFADGQGFILEQATNAITPIPMDGQMTAAEWLNNQTLVYEVFKDNKNAIYTYTIGGSSSLLVGTLGDTAYFTVGK